jgi:hypothetical protein
MAMFAKMASTTVMSRARNLLSVVFEFIEGRILNSLDVN